MLKQLSSAFYFNLLVIGISSLSIVNAQEPMLNLTLRYQQETTPNSGRYHRLSREEQWPATQTAVIICDLWDSHHSVNAVRRVAEITPRIDAFAKQIRSQGGVVIHAPSDCMDAYADHAARRRAQTVEIADTTPEDIDSWCDQIPAELAAAYPLDQSDGGEDDEKLEHLQWAAILVAEGRNSDLPWIKQTAGVAIDADRDFISDKGPEIWNILHSNGIKNVFLVGVHTNMCVLGRPFGLRQLKQHGMSAVLVRDLTDTMYNPESWPFVSHFSGTDLIVDHVERFVCPTTTSDDVLGGIPVRFAGDYRKHLAILIAEDEYETNRTLTEFADAFLRKDLRVSLIYGPEPIEKTAYTDGIPGIEAIADADVLLVSVRRRPLPADQLEIVRKFAAQAKPIVGLRTASHAFSLRDEATPDGLASWKEFDSQIFGGNYTNHHGNSEVSRIVAVDNVPLFLFDSNSFSRFESKGSLYRTSPLAPGTAVLLEGTVEGSGKEPVAWTFVRPDSGKSFYTSLGHATDFDQPPFRQLLVNAVRWASDLPPLSSAAVEQQLEQYKSGQGRQRK